MPANFRKVSTALAHCGNIALISSAFLPCSLGSCGVASVSRRRFLDLWTGSILCVFRLTRLASSSSAVPFLDERRHGSSTGSPSTMASPARLASPAAAVAVDGESRSGCVGAPHTLKYYFWFLLDARVCFWYKLVL